MSGNGTMVLTFVNKWYLVDMLVDLFKCRFKKSIQERQGKYGVVYSEVYQLESRWFLAPGDKEGL